MNKILNKSALLIILDGLGDRPCSQLHGATPLEYANTPEMDRLLQQGICGLTYPLLPGIPVDTHTGTAPLLGLNYHTITQLARGPIEAAGVNMAMESGDLVCRANFATFTEGYLLQDRRAGRVDRGADALTQAINQIGAINGVDFEFKRTTGHRAVVRMRAEGLSTAISNTDPGRAMLQTPPQCEALQNDPAAHHTANTINLWSRTVFERLVGHPLNREREERGELAANGIILRGAGKFHPYDNLLTTLGISPLVITAESTLQGLAALCGFKSVTSPSFTALPNTNIPAKVEMARKALQQFPLVILHFKAPDICAHDQDPMEKARFIESVDRSLPPLLNDAYATVITADHSTSSESGHHSGDPVPTLIHYPGVRRDRCSRFSEVECMQGGLGTINSQSVLLMLLDGMGWLHNYQVKDRWILQ
jgi:2,3-bisphosphoglycerate-independent phosphoglycerate mutase